MLLFVFIIIYFMIFISFNIKFYKEHPVLTNRLKFSIGSFIIVIIGAILITLVYYGKISLPM